MENKTMLTDLYQLTMDASYLDSGMEDDIATFDLFIRSLPKDWGYYIANGIEDAIDYATSIKFEEDDIYYLSQQGIFAEDFIESLRGFKFSGEIYAVKEGTPVFPNEPVMRVTAKRSEAQFLETTLLNIINFQTMIASKTSRVVNAAQGGAVVDFGLRRAQGEDAAMEGARAAYIGGAVGTSNVKAGKEYDIPITGTHAHSFVMSFDNEIDAFRAYVKTFPENATLLIDTYDTLEGARNAATVAKELEGKGYKLGAVRLDSGDLADLSIKVREILDGEGLGHVRIVASNDLNEYKIEDMIAAGAKTTAYGVGTELITAKPTAAIPGVYKLAEDSSGAKIKLSEGKRTLPGRKQVYRVLDEEGNPDHDVIALEGEVEEGTPMLEQVVSEGGRVMERKTLAETRQYALGEVAKLAEGVKRIREPAGYRVEVSERLNSLAERLAERYGAHDLAHN